MAQIRVSFTTGLVALSLAICLVVALAFVDRSRRIDENSSAAPNSGAYQPATREQGFLQASALSEPLERPQVMAGSNQVAPELNWQGTTAAQVDSGAELPLAPHLQSRIATVPQPTPQMSPAELAALSPEALAKRFQGKAVVPANASIPGVQPMPGNDGAPPIAVPEGMYYAKATPVPTATPRYTPARGPLPIITNDGGVDGALRNLGVNSVAGISSRPGDPSLPFSHPGTVSTDRLRAALAGDTSFDSTSGMTVDSGPAPLQASTNAGPGGWEPVQYGRTAPGSQRIAAATPNPMLMIKGGRPQSQPQGTAAEAIPGFAAEPNSDLSISTPMLQPNPEDADSLLNSILSNDPAAAGAAATLTPDNNWNLPPAPSLNAPVIQPGAGLDTSKITEAPSLAGGASTKPNATLLPLEEDKPLPGADLPAALANKLGASDAVSAASVDERTLTAREAAQRADAMAYLEGRTLDEDLRRMMSRTAAESWADMVALAEEARRQSITVAPSEFSALLQKRHLDPLKIEEALRKAGLTPSEIESELRDLCLGEKLVDQTLAEKFDEQKLRSIYEKNPQEFQSPRRLHVQEIFKARPADGAAVRQVERDMDKLHQQVRSGADFGLLATQASEAPTRSQGGDLGWLDDRSAITEDMAKALMPLKQGQVSEIVSTPKGYYIYKLVNLQEPVPGFEGVRERIVTSLRDEVRDGLQSAAIAKANVELSHKSKKTKVASNRTSRDRDAEIVKVLKSNTNRANAQPKPSAGSHGNGLSIAGAGVQAHNSHPAMGQPHGQEPVVPGFGGDISHGAPPTPATVSNQASGPRNAVQNFFGRFRRPSPTIQQ